MTDDALKMTVVVCTIDTFETVSRLMEHLETQEGRELCELIIVCPDAGQLNLPDNAGHGFARVNVLEAGPFPTRGVALAKAVRAAQTPIVALTEDHCFPQPGWLLNLLRAHDGPWAAVSATLANANPQSALSWCDLLVGHGEIVGPRRSGERERLGGHNVSYKREVLLDLFPDSLDVMLDTEPIHHELMIAAGHKLYLAGDAITNHTNFELLSGWMMSQFIHGRLYGAQRCRRWTTGQKVWFILGSPLSPVARIVRMLRKRGDDEGQYHRLAGKLTILFIGISTSVLGEVIGCLAGSGNSQALLTRMEFQRYRYYNPRFHNGNNSSYD